MNCKECNYLLYDYLDGKLSSHTKAALEQHLTSCPDCSRRLEQLQTQEPVEEEPTGLFLYLMKPSGGYKRIFFAGAMMTLILFAILLYLHFRVAVL